MPAQVSEAVGRAARTGIQMTPAAVLTELLDIFIFDMDERGYLAVFAGLTLTFGYLQAAVENAQGRGWWFREVPPNNVPVEGA